MGERESIRLRRDLKAALKMLSQKEHRDMSYLLDKAVENYLTAKMFKPKEHGKGGLSKPRW